MQNTLDDIKTPTGGPPQWISNNLLALASAAVLTVYSAGYARTRAAAERFDNATSERRRPVADIAEMTHPGGYVPSTLTAAPTPTSERSPSVIDAANVPAPMPLPAPATAATGGPVPAATTSAAATAATVAPASVPPAVEPPTDKPAPRVEVVATPTPVAPVMASATTTAMQIADSAASTVQKEHGFKDGIYAGWGSSRHGDIQATIEVRAGRIISATITQCQTRYPCSRIAALPPEVVTRQSSEVDFVSRATDSTNAFYSAVVDALSKAK